MRLASRSLATSAIEGLRCKVTGSHMLLSNETEDKPLGKSS